MHFCKDVAASESRDILGPHNLSVLFIVPARGPLT